MRSILPCFTTILVISMCAVSVTADVNPVFEHPDRVLLGRIYITDDGDTSPVRKFGTALKCGKGGEFYLNLNELEEDYSEFYGEVGQVRFHFLVDWRENCKVLKLDWELELREKEPIVPVLGTTRIPIGKLQRILLLDRERKSIFMDLEIRRTSDTYKEVFADYFDETTFWMTKPGLERSEIKVKEEVRPSPLPAEGKRAEPSRIHLKVFRRSDRREEEILDGTYELRSGNAIELKRGTE